MSMYIFETGKKKKEKSFPAEIAGACGQKCLKKLIVSFGTVFNTPHVLVTLLPPPPPLPPPSPALSFERVCNLRDWPSLIPPSVHTCLRFFSPLSVGGVLQPSVNLHFFIEVE